MGKSTISMVIFNSYVTNYQRVLEYATIVKTCCNMTIFHNSIHGTIVVATITSPK